MNLSFGPLVRQGMDATCWYFLCQSHKILPVLQVQSTVCVHPCVYVSRKWLLLS